jgi:hypothetical protein
MGLFTWSVIILHFFSSDHGGCLQTTTMALYSAAGKMIATRRFHLVNERASIGAAEDLNYITKRKTVELQMTPRMFWKL